YGMQPLLRALEKYDPGMMRWFAGDGYRAKYEASQPVQDWFRYSMARDGRGDPQSAGAMREFIDKMPAERRTKWDQWYADYGRRLGIRDEATYQRLLNTDRTTGRVPGQQAAAAAPSPLALPNHDIITVSDPRIQQAVYEQFHLNLQPSTSVDELMGRADIPLLHAAQPAPASPSSSPTHSPPSQADLERFMLEPALTNADLHAPTFRRPEDGQPYTEEAIRAANEARQAGFKKGLQLWIMAKTEVTARTATDVGAHIETRGRSSVREIWLKTAGTFVGLAGAGGLALPLKSMFEGNHVTTTLSLILAGAVSVRGGVELASAISKELTRKTSEAHNEQRVARLTWTEWMKDRFVKHGPRTGLGSERFRGPDSVEEMSREWISILSHLIGTPVDLSSGETNDMRSMLIQSEHGLGVSQIGRRIGAAQGAIEPFNYRTPTGRIFAWAASVGFEAGFLTALGDVITHPEHIYSYGLALGTLLYAQHRAMAAISARHGVDWTARPLPTRIMSIGANGILTASSLGFAGAEFANGKLWQGAFLTGAAYALGQFTRAGIRSELAKTNPELRASPSDSLPAWREKLLDPAFFPGHPGPAGPGKPKWVPLHRMVLGAALIGLGVTYFLQFLEEEDKKKHPGGPASPSPTPTHSISPSPTPSSTQSPTRTPSPSGVSPTTRSPVRPTP
ncbi:MAG: hypothetical protein WBP94_00830, partial [Rhodomicrobiaceae bacterium]